MNYIRRLFWFPITSKHSAVRLIAECLLCIALSAVLTFAIIRVADVYEQRDDARMAYMEAQARLDMGQGEARYWIAKWENDPVLRGILRAK